MAEDEKRRQEKLSEEDLGKVYGGKGSQDEVEQTAPIDDEDEDIVLQGKFGSNWGGKKGRRKTGK